MSKTAQSGLVKEIDENLALLKTPIPYHELDYVLNIAYDVLSGHVRLEDIELHRQDSGYLDALGAERIPYPTTAGDFTRRFGRDDIVKLMESVNTVRERVWAEGRKEALEEALIITNMRKSLNYQAVSGNYMKNDNVLKKTTLG